MEQFNFHHITVKSLIIQKRQFIFNKLTSHHKIKRRKQKTNEQKKLKLDDPFYLKNIEFKKWIELIITTHTPRRLIVPRSRTASAA